MLEDKIKLAKMNPELVADEIGIFIVNQVLKFNSTGAVLGISGGVDSTCTAALAERGFKIYNKLDENERIKKYENYNPNKHAKNMELFGYMLPSNTNAKEDESDGKKVATRLGIFNETLNIEPIVEAFRYTNPEIFKANYHKGNAMSRIRANVLHTKGATENKIVLGTGNKDEDFGIGYYTLFGDGAVHISPIAKLAKRLVREMATYLGFADLANRVPTAGLEPGQTDFKDLCYKYDIVELVTEGLQQGFKKEELYKNGQITTLVDEQLKEYNKIYGKPKLTNAKDIVNDVIYRHENIAKPKGQLICPPMPNITLVYE